MRLRYFLLTAILLLACFLRFNSLAQIPHGLYIDEVSIGNNAYAVLTTGRDEHGVAYPLFFQAFGEYKMPVAIYLTSFSMALFGKTEFAVRFFSALFGTLTVAVLYFFALQLFKKPAVAILSAFFLAISPWHIQFSRGGFEANIALFFYVVAGFLYLQFLHNKKLVWLSVSLIALVITVYTYNSYKLIAPLMLIFSLAYLYSKSLVRKKLFLTIILASCLLLLPVLLFQPANTRLFETSAFLEYANLSLLHKIVVYPLVYLRNYLAYFSLPFLFVTGDGFGRHTIVGMGPLFRFQLLFLVAGLFYLVKNNKQFFAKVILLLLLLAPLPAALTRPSPHALRSFLLVIPLTILTAYGFVLLWQKKNTLIKPLFIILGLVALYEIGMYFHLYYYHYPMRTALDWGAEFRQTVFTLAKKQPEYSQIVISNQVGMIASYNEFYNTKLAYQLVDANWQKPAGRKVLYVTVPDTKKNAYLQKIPHKLIQNIYFPNLNHDIFVQFWEI